MKRLDRKLVSGPPISSLALDTLGHIMRLRRERRTKRLTIEEFFAATGLQSHHFNAAMVELGSRGLVRYSTNGRRLRFLVDRAREVGEILDEASGGNFFPHRRLFANEAEIETLFAARLDRIGEAATRQVECAAGVADIVTARAVYEVKHNPGRGDVFRAVGQASLYAACLGGVRVPAVVTNKTRDAVLLAPFIRQAGVEVHFVTSKHA